MFEIILLFLLGTFFVGYLVGKNSSKKVDDSELVRRNIEWSRFINSYKKVAKTKPEKNLIASMLKDIKTSGLPIAGDIDLQSDEDNKPQRANLVVPSPTSVSDITNDTGAVFEAYSPEGDTDSSNDEYAIFDNQANNEIDGASLLLYFGAFLFIASAGLFVAFGDIAGEIKTLIVALMVGILYTTGIWLHENKEKFSQVGVTFAGIGLAIAPLTGLTAYNYVFEESSGAVIWFATSLLCLALYGHAMFTLKKPLLNYVFIFTFLSLFESSVAIIDAPVYFFGWGLAAVGIIAMIAANSRYFDEEFKESSKVSSYLLIPLALLVSFAMVATEGILQLSVSLIIGSIYYFVQAKYTNEQEPRSLYYLASHIIGLLGLGTLSFGVTEDFVQTSILMLAITALQTFVFMIFVKKDNIYADNLASVIVTSTIISTLIGISNSVLLLIGTILTFITCLLLWFIIKRQALYILAILIMPVISLISSLLVADPQFNAGQVAFTLSLAFIGQAALFLALYKQLDDISINSTKLILIATSVLSILVSFGDAPVAAMLFALITILTLLLIAHINKDNELISATAIIVLLPILKSIDSSGEELFYTVAIALMFNIVMALKYRYEIFRWVGSLVWFIVPPVLNQSFSLGWGPEAFAWGYFGIALGYLTARSIARGVAFTSTKIPMSAYDQDKSVSYVIGYYTSLVLALAISLASDDSQLHTSVLLALTMGLVVYIAKILEKAPILYASLPIIAQLILLSAFRPELNVGGIFDNYIFNLYVCASVITAGISYWYAGMFVKDEEDITKPTPALTAQVISIGTMYTTTVVAIGIGQTWAMPVALFIAGSLTLYHLRSEAQVAKELAGAVILASVFWMLNIQGVTEVQVYSHILAVFFAGYAYWRYTLNNPDLQQGYTIAALVTATLPLVLQALGGESGDLYGWWLLIEQIGFMLIGLAIKDRLITFWGLTVAIGAVLYQLRELQWAALTLIALAIIGVAVYKISKTDDK